MNVEERLTALETDRATLTRIASEQMLRLRDIEHNEAILLGVAQSQGQDIKQMKADIEAVKTDIEAVKTDIEAVKTDLATMNVHLGQLENHFDERLDALIAMVKALQPPASRA